jgi:flavodoxin I
MMKKGILAVRLLAAWCCITQLPVEAWVYTSPTAARRPTLQLWAQSVGIYYGTSTGSTQTVASLIYEQLVEQAGDVQVGEPVDIESVDIPPGSTLAQVLASHSALIVGTPTWNTGADTERSGTGWDEVYYKSLSGQDNVQVLAGKTVAVFGLGDQISYGDNYADAAGELYDVFEAAGCRMVGSWSQEGYEHTDSKSIRGDKFCGLLLDMVKSRRSDGGTCESMGPPTPRGRWTT